MKEVWIGTVEYTNGESFTKEFPYTANGNYLKEQSEQYDIESWLLENAPYDISFYSVDYVTV